MNIASLNADNLGFAWNERVIFAGLSFTLQSGQALRLTGPNGAGKSTLLRLIAGLLPLQAGAISFTPEIGALIREQIHYIGHLNGLKPALTARENLLFAQSLLAADHAPPDLEPAVEQLALHAFLDQPVANLSAGQKKRVQLARLVLTYRTVWLLDEAASALDAAGKSRLGDIITAHLDAGGMVLAASHEQDSIAYSHHIDMGHIDMGAGQ